MARKKKVEEEAAEEEVVYEGAGEEESEEGMMIDFSEVDDPAGFELMPRGKYQGEVVELDYEISSKGNPMWKWVIELIEGDFKGRKLFTYTAFSDKALPMTKMTIARVYPELLEAPFDPEQVADDEILIGTRVTAKVITQKYEGEKRNAVKELLAPEGGDEFME